MSDPSPPAPALFELSAPEPDDAERVWVPGHVRRERGRDIYVKGYWRLKTKTARRG